MTSDELMKFAEGEESFEEVGGQLWLEREEVLRRVNSRPPQLREAEVRHQMRLLRARIDREGRDRHVQLTDPSRIPDNRVRRRW